MEFKLPKYQLDNVPHPDVKNMGLTTSIIDIDTGVFFPRPIPQIEAETAFSQNSPAMNQDIVISGNALKDVSFLNITQNTLLDLGVAVINPVIDTKTSNALRYQGYNVCDGGFDGLF